VAAIAAIVSVKTNVSMVDAMVRAAAVAATPARVAARMSSMWPMALVARCSSGWTLSPLMSAGDSFRGRENAGAEIVAGGNAHPHGHIETHGGPARTAPHGRSRW
jgi:hypothetical protein